MPYAAKRRLENEKKFKKEASKCQKINSFFAKRSSGEACEKGHPSLSPSLEELATLLLRVLSPDLAQLLRPRVLIWKRILTTHSITRPTLLLLSNVNKPVLHPATIQIQWKLWKVKTNRMKVVQLVGPSHPKPNSKPGLFVRRIPAGYKRYQQKDRAWNPLHLPRENTEGKCKTFKNKVYGKMSRLF